MCGHNATEVTDNAGNVYHFYDCGNNGVKVECVADGIEAHIHIERMNRFGTYPSLKTGLEVFSSLYSVHFADGGVHIPSEDGQYLTSVVTTAASLSVPASINIISYPSHR